MHQIAFGDQTPPEPVGAYVLAKTPVAELHEGDGNEEKEGWKEDGEERFLPVASTSLLKRSLSCRSLFVIMRRRKFSNGRCVEVVVILMRRQAKCHPRVPSTRRPTSGGLNNWMPENRTGPKDG